MAFQYQGIGINKLETLWPLIGPKLSPQISDQLRKQLDLVLQSKDEEQEDNLSAFVEICCSQKPADFEEYIAYVMIATCIELLKTPSMLFSSQKSRLIAHTFSTYIEYRCRDEEKVVAAVESIWKVTTEPSNINHIILTFHGYNQFTFNMSITLLLQALGALTQDNVSDKLPLVPIDAVLQYATTLNIFESKSNKQTMYDFLILFQSFQRLLAKHFARDDSLKDLLSIQLSQLKDLEKHLKTVNEVLNRQFRGQVTSSQIHQDTLIGHHIELTLNNMSCITQNCPLI